MAENEMKYFSFLTRTVKNFYPRKKKNLPAQVHAAPAGHLVSPEHQEVAQTHGSEP